MKTIITASIDSNLARKLATKTKGTRSRTVQRAIEAYLKGETDFSIVDVPTKTLVGVLHGRLKQENNWVDTPLTLLLNDLVKDLL